MMSFTADFQGFFLFKFILDDNSIFHSSHNIEIKRPENITTDSSNTFRDLHDEHFRPRDRNVCHNQWDHYFERNENSGLNGTKAKLIQIKEHFLDGANFTIIDIEVECDKNETPWCEC